jgi:predicted cupin superfamily sugar epimerase
MQQQALQAIEHPLSISGALRSPEAPEMTADKLIIHLGLKPLPWEGGWYRETWRTETTIPSGVLSDAYSGARSAGTAIYYLLTPDTVSRMHRLPSDETFHFYMGDPVEMLLLYAHDAPVAAGTISFGHDLLHGQQVQFTVPGNTWMGARLKQGGTKGFALMGTTVSPGFDFDDLEMGVADDLVAAYPDREELIRDLS